MGAPIGGSDDEPLAAINVVPLVDIILVVLIIFMVTAPMIIHPSINVNLPKAASGTSSQPSKLNLMITAAGVVSLNGKVATDDEITAYATKLVAQDPTVQAVISADKDTLHGKVVSVIDLVKNVGVKRFAIAVDQESKPSPPSH